MQGSEEPTITLYDLAGASKTAGCFSPNTWRIRLALNYKQLRFKTIWVHLVEIKPALQQIGLVPPQSSPSSSRPPRYTVPTLVDATAPGPPIIITESLQIAEYLDESYPDPPLVPAGTKAVSMLFHQHLEKQVMPLFYPLIVPNTGESMAEKDRAYLRETLQQWLGPRFEEMMSQSEEAREENWKRLQDELGELARLLDENGPMEENPWVLGDRVSRGDFVLLALFLWMRKAVPEGWRRIERWNGGRWERMMRLSESWRANEA